MTVTAAPREHPSRYHYNQGCKCRDCTRAAARYEQERQLDRLAGKPRRLPALGTRRRLQALCALGWDWYSLANHIGASHEVVRTWAMNNQFVYARTAATVRVLYDELSMKLPPENTTAQRNAASRARGRAKRRGWPPPLAWDDEDLDNPDAVPAGVDPVSSTVANRTIPDDLTHAINMGWDLTETAQAMNMTPDYLWQWCKRHDHRDLYNQLSRRMTGRGHKKAQAAS
jgi:hypothetical protein